MGKGRTVTKRSTRVPKTRNYYTWTESQYFGRIRSILRNGFRYWKPAYIALENASRIVKTKKGKRKEYQCDVCKNWFPRKLVQIHHIQECGSLSSYEDIVPFLQRLTNEDVTAYRVLCTKDHNELTKKFNNKQQIIKT